MDVPLSLIDGMSSGPDIFVSYSREDQATARRFAEAFEQAGLRVWWDQSLSPGEAFDQVTEKALDEARAVVVLWSKKSVESRWVRAEAMQAHNSRRLVPVMIEPCRRPLLFELTQTADLSGWNGDPEDPAWTAFVGGVRKFTGAGTATEAAPSPAPSPRAGRKSGRVAIIAGVAVLGVAVLAGAILWRSGGTPGDAERTAGARGDAAATSAPPSIAVLPFADLSPSRDQEFFADGLTEEILNSLARIPDLKVSGRTSSFYFKGRNEDLKAIGEKLGVAFLLEGSVRKSGDELRITAQLIKAVDGFHVWSQTYDRSRQDIFRIQEEIARSVADVLQVALGVGDLARSAGTTRDIQAYEAWLEGRARVRTLSTDGTRSAIPKFEFAVQRDPHFEHAWLSLQDGYRLLSSILTEREGVAEARRKAAETIDVAIEKNPQSELLPLVRDFERRVNSSDWLEMARLWPRINQALSRYGLIDNIDARGMQGQWHIAVDKAGIALPTLQDVSERDPLESPMILAEALSNLGRLAEATAQRQRGLAMQASELLAMNELLAVASTTDKAAIEKAWQRARSLSNDPVVAAMFELRQQPQEALRELARREGTIPSSRLALWAAMFGDPARAVQYLRQDDDEQRRRVTALSLWRPIMRDARRLPEFKALVREWGFVDYWREFGWGEHCRPVGADDFTCQ